LKQYLDSWIIDGIDGDKKSWGLKRDVPDQFKAWLQAGSPLHDSLLVVRVEIYFPLCEDPEIILKAVN